MALSAVGTLYDNPVVAGTATWSQPGGPGTLVYPQQTLGQKSAMYSFGCGHFFNLPRIVKAYNPATGKHAALVCCPCCSYVQRIIEPYSEFIDYIATPIVVA